MNPDAPMLDYGQTVLVEPINHTSAGVGMRCCDSRTGQGFSLSRDDYLLS